MKQKKQEQTNVTIRKRHHKQKLNANTHKGFRKEFGRLDRFENRIRKGIATGRVKVRPMITSEDGIVKSEETKKGDK